MKINAGQNTTIDNFYNKRHYCDKNWRHMGQTLQTIGVAASLTSLAKLYVYRSNVYTELIFNFVQNNEIKKMLDKMVMKMKIEIFSLKNVKVSLCYNTQSKLIFSWTNFEVNT